MISVDEICQALQQQGLAQRGTRLQGECPNCGKQSLWTEVARPFKLFCNHQNSCGFEISAQEFAPHVFAPKIPTTTTNAQAVAYLVRRGFDLAVVLDWNTKGVFGEAAFFSSDKKIGCPTVRFALSKETYWERLCSHEDIIGRKANIKGSYAGSVWHLPGAQLGNKKELWVTEGIFDALSLEQAGLSVVAAMSCNNDITPWLQAQNWAHPPAIVIAFDNDIAGKKYAQKLANNIEKAGFGVQIALPPAGDDWNSLLKNKGARWLQTHIDSFLQNGAHLSAQTMQDAAILACLSTRTYACFLIHDGEMYHFEANFAKDWDIDKALNSLTQARWRLAFWQKEHGGVFEATNIKHICNGFLDVVAAQKNTEKDEYSYVVKITTKTNTETFVNLPGGTFATPAKFIGDILSHSAGVNLTLDAHYCQKLRAHLLQKQLPIIEESTFVGRNTQGVYLFADFAVYAGKMHYPNGYGYFDLGKKGCFKTSLTTDCPTLYHGEGYKNALQLICEGWGAKGASALAFVVGSLFAEQLREDFGFFPFLEIFGPKETGKSTLVRAMYALLGIKNYEGVEPSSHKTNPKALRNKLAAFSCLPIAFKEGDAQNFQYDFSQHKAIFNGNAAVKETASFSQRIDNNRWVFRGALMSVQNAPIESDDATLSRFIKLYFNAEAATAQTRQSAEALARLKIEDIGGFLPTILCPEKSILANIPKIYNEMRGLWQKQYPQSARVVECAALVYAVIKSAAIALPWLQGVADLAKIGLEQAIVERIGDFAQNNQEVQAFWEVFAVHLPTLTNLNVVHFGQNNDFMFSLTSVLSTILQEDKNKTIPHVLNISNLTRALVYSRAPKYIANSRQVTVNTGMRKVRQRMWVFADFDCLSGKR